MARKDAVEVYTVGHTEAYLGFIANSEYGITKAGRTEDSDGGIAFASIDEAIDWCKERGIGLEWSVWQVEADWNADTYWCHDYNAHAFNKDVPIKPTPIKPVYDNEDKTP